VLVAHYMFYVEAGNNVKALDRAEHLSLVSMQLYVFPARKSLYSPCARCQSIPPIDFLHASRANVTQPIEKVAGAPRTILMRLPS